MNTSTKNALYNLCVNQRDLLLIDVSNYLHRYLWVNQNLSVDIDGEETLTGHLYGFTNLVHTLGKRYPNCSIVLALDGQDRERREYDSNYKAQRTHTYNLKSNLNELLAMCGLYPNIYSCYDSTREADDVIYAVSKKVKSLCDAKGIDKNIYILSNDKDMYQCVSDEGSAIIHIIRKFGQGGRWLTDAEIVDTKAVKEKFNNVSPANLVKFRAIVGDSSDNLKGYYRFRKSNASVIAENFDVTEQRLVPSESKDIDTKWLSYLKPIEEDYSIFYKNYMIMKLKDFDFSLDPLNPNDSDLERIVKLILKYELTKYRYTVCMDSPYRAKLIELFNRFASRE